LTFFPHSFPCVARTRQVGRELPKPRVAVEVIEPTEEHVAAVQAAEEAKQKASERLSRMMSMTRHSDMASPAPSPRVDVEERKAQTRSRLQVSVTIKQSLHAWITSLLYTRSHL
jgi:hypothetical protein